MSNDELESIANKVLGKSRDGEVTTKEKLKEALPLLFSLEKAIDDSNGYTAKIRAIYDRISQSCVEYVLDHVSALDEPLTEERKGVKNGTITIDGVVYRLTETDPGRPRRESGANFSKDFVDTLPDEWCSIKRQKVDAKIKAASDDERRKYKIICPAEYFWSKPEKP